MQIEEQHPASSHSSMTLITEPQRLVAVNQQVLAINLAH
jgi:hypothetical protein